MSSHHIIRENQEPALLILDVQAIDQELLGQLLEWSPILITTDKLLPYFIYRHIKIDAVLLITDQSLPVTSQPIEAFIATPDQIMEKSFSYLAKRRQHSVNILTDKKSFPEIEKYLDRYSVVIFSNNTRYTTTTTYEKWLPKDTILEIRSFDKMLYTTNGLVQIANDEFSVLEDGFVKVATKNNSRIYIGEKL